MAQPHDFLYWDYGHNRERYDQAVRMGKWKGIEYGVGGEIELSDLSKDIGEENNLAQQNSEIVARISDYMK